MAATAPLPKRTATLAPSSGPSQPRAPHRMLTMPTTLNTNLLDIELQPLPSPYSPLGAATIAPFSSLSSMTMGMPTSIDSALSQFKSSFANSFNSQPRSDYGPGAGLQRSNTFTPANSPIHFVSMNFDTYSPPPTTFQQSMIGHLKANMNPTLNKGSTYTDSEMDEIESHEMDLPARKKAKFVSQGLTRWDSRGSMCSDMSCDTDNQDGYECTSDFGSPRN